MYNENLKNKHYSLVVTFSLFILVMASLVMVTLIQSNTENDFHNKLEEINYNSIDSINPLVINRAKQDTDKTANNIEIVEEIKRVYNIQVL